MLGTWDRYRVEVGRWHRAADRAPRHQPQDRFSVFMASIDRLFYIAAAALIVCLVSIVVA
jgi:hypothetical protein